MNKVIKIEDILYVVRDWYWFERYLNAFKLFLNIVFRRYYDDTPRIDPYLAFQIVKNIWFE
jgi:hypothetical protein